MARRVLEEDTSCLMWKTSQGVRVAVCWQAAGGPIEAVAFGVEEGEAEGRLPGLGTGGVSGQGTGSIRGSHTESSRIISKGCVRGVSGQGPEGVLERVILRVAEELVRAVTAEALDSSFGSGSK